MKSSYINRSIEQTAKEICESFPVVLITGARQVGKSTMIEYVTHLLGKKINSVTFDDLELRKQAKEDPKLFLDTHDAPLLIDEFQYAPDLLSYIKIRVDESRRQSFNKDTQTTGLYFITGSQIFKTMREASESLAGRIGVLNLYGLSQRELSNMPSEAFIPNIDTLKKREPVAKLSVGELFRRIITGSYPELHTNAAMKKDAFYNSYIKTYIERDIRELINVKDELKFLKFIRSVAARTAQELNLNDICNDVGISNPTAGEWLSILVNTGLVFLLQPYSGNTVNRIVKRPKVYFMDTGLACFLAGFIDAVTLERSSYNGAIFETYVISEIIKSFANVGKSAEQHLHYYRDKAGKEIDLLIFFNNTVYPLEIKKGTNPGKDAIANFDVLKSFGVNVGNGVVVCLNDQIFALDAKNYLVPVWYI